MKGLQSAVAIMSVLIVLAIGLLGYGIYKRFGGSSDSDSGTGTTATAQQQAQADAAIAQARAEEENIPPTIALNNQEIIVAPGPQGLKNITLPPRSSIRQMMPYKNGVALHVRTTKGEYIFYINAVTAKMEGALKINYAPNTPAPRPPAQQNR